MSDVDRETKDRFLKNLSRARTIYHALTDGIMIFDEAGRVSSINPAAEAVIGRLEKDVSGKSTFGMPEIEKILASRDLVEDQQKVRCREAKNCAHQECPSYDSNDLRCWLQCGTYCHNEIQGTFQQKRDACERCDVYINNGIRVVELERNGSFYTAQISPILNEDGQEDGRLLIFHNITDLRKAQNRLVMRNQDLTLLNEISSMMTHSIVDVDYVINGVFRTIMDSLSVDAGALVIRDPKSLELRIFCSSGFTGDETAGLDAALVPMNALLGMSDLDFDGIRQIFLRKFRSSGALGEQFPLDPFLAPLQLRSTWFGFLMVADRERDMLAENEMVLLTNIAGQLSMYLQNADLFTGIVEREREWKTTFNAMTDAVSIHDTNFNIIRANQSMKERFKSSGNIIGRKCYEVVHESSQIPGGCPCKEILRHGRGLSLELEDEQLGSIILTVDPIHSGSGKITGFVHVIKDITEQKQLRSQLLQSEKMAAVGQLVSGVAHELNNPLASIMGYAQFLLMPEEDGGGSSTPNDLQIIFDESRRASRIVGNLLSFARKHESKKEYVDINEVTAKIMELKTYEFRVAGITVNAELDPAIPRTMADRHQIEQVLLNLVNNAQQAITDVQVRKGVIDITTRSLNGAVEVAVRDNGPGMSPEVQTRVFEPFFTTKEVGKGTGLGLSICYGIVREHDGDIRVKSETDKGAEFIVSLPVSSAESLDDANSDADAGAVSSPKRHCVLVVEDEPSFSGLLEKVLTGDGHKVDVAANGMEALKKLKSKSYDNVITDIKMPEMDGPELFEHIAGIDPSLSDNVIFITGDSLNPETRRFLEERNNICLEKPFDLMKVREAIRSAGHN